MDIHYNNQKVFCDTNRVPFFASRSCSHMYPWVQDERYGNTQTLGEMLVAEYGEEKALELSISSHITSCPVCSRSWCD